VSRSKKISLGFQVVDTRTSAALSEVFDRRGPAREVAVMLTKTDPTRSVGVRHLEDYVAADASREDVAALRAAARAMLPPGTVRTA
jgi:hypothetical protein